MATFLQINQFVEQLKSHDWYFSYSDDITVWRRGNEQLRRINADAAKDAALMQAYQAYHDCVWDTKTPAAERYAKRDQVIEQLRNHALTQELIRSTECNVSL